MFSASKPHQITNHVALDCCKKQHPNLLQSDPNTTQDHHPWAENVAGAEAVRRIFWAPEAQQTGHTNMAGWWCWGQEDVVQGGQVQEVEHTAFHALPSLAKAQEVVLLKYFEELWS